MNAIWISVYHYFVAILVYTIPSHIYLFDTLLQDLFIKFSVFVDVVVVICCLSYCDIERTWCNLLT